MFSTIALHPYLPNCALLLMNSLHLIFHTPVLLSVADRPGNWLLNKDEQRNELMRNEISYFEKDGVRERSLPMNVLRTTGHMEDGDICLIGKSPLGLCYQCGFVVWLVLTIQQHDEVDCWKAA